MLSYQLSDDLQKRLTELNVRIAKTYAKTMSYSDEARSSIHRYAFISMIGASTRIENALLTDAEIDWIDTILTTDGKVTQFDANRSLIENKLSKDRERSIEEVAGCRNMLQLIYAQSQDFTPMSETIIRGLHHELLRHYSHAGPNVGKYKVQSNSVVEHHHQTGARRTVFQTADPGPMTQTAMSDLVSWYNDAKPKVSSSITLACEFVYRFLAIHPFQDGNGRLGRGLFLLSLLQSVEEPVRYLAPYLAIDRHIEQRKPEYYFVLNRCSDGKFKNNPDEFHIEFFLDYMIKVIDSTLNDIVFYKDKFEAYQKLSESAIQILDCFKVNPEIRLTTKLLCEQTGIPRRTVTNALAMLVKKQFIQSYGQKRSVRYQLIF